MTKLKYNPVPLADPTKQDLFIQDAPNALNPDFIYKSSSDDDCDYTIEIQRNKQHETGLKKNNKTVKTPIFGYSQNEEITWPGKTFEVHTNIRTKVKWQNKLIENNKPLKHFLPIDESLHWCYSLKDKSRNIIEDGIPLVPHLHGGHSSPEADGNPEYFEGTSINSRGPRFVSNEYVYDNSQRACCLWYHDHALGITRLNVYAGLAGFYIIRDDFDTGEHDNPLDLPAKPYELVYCVQDRQFLETGELFYPAYKLDKEWDDYIDSNATPPIKDGPSALAEFFGDHILVNGKLWPKANVEPRHYRIRLLNGCDSRFMRIQLRCVDAGATDFEQASEPLVFTVIGSDQGLLKQSTNVTNLDFMPGERLDIVFDFSSVPENSRIIVENILGDEPFTGELPDVNKLDNDRRTNRIMAFDVTVELDPEVNDKFDKQCLDSKIDGLYPEVSKTINKYRKLGLYEGRDHYGRLMPMLGTAEPVTDMSNYVVNGSLVWNATTTENPIIDETEIWDIYNATGDAHPIHVHLVHFEIMSRKKFNVDVPGVVVKQQIKTHGGETGIGYRLENTEITPVTSNPVLPSENGPKDMVLCYPGEVTRIKMTFDRIGRYVWHCHILSHEDHEMMRVLEVTEPKDEE
jgi:FtsP/CotA-like multicopper oxidase with cupredoxin domain